METPLREPLDGQNFLKQLCGSNYHVGDGWYCDFTGHQFVESQRSYYTEDYGYCDLYFDYKHDMIEEDALNEKSCMQVMKAMIDKADEEINELEEDIVMLQCQLAWDDDDWSNPCSTVMKERINHLDFSIQILKSECMKEIHDYSIKREEHEIFHQKLHDLLKPRLETYFLAKSKQALNTVLGSVNCVDIKPSKEQLASSLMPVCAFTSVGLVKSGENKSVSKVVAKKRVNLKGKTMPVGPNEKKTMNPKQKSTSKTTPVKKSQKRKENRGMEADERSRKPPQMASRLLNCMEIVEMEMDEKEKINVKNSSAPSKFAKDELLAKDTNKLNKQVGRRLPKSFFLNPVKTSSLKLEETTSNTSMKDTGVKFISKKKVILREFKHESEVTSRKIEPKSVEIMKHTGIMLDSHLVCVKQINGEFSESPKDGHFINTKSLSQKPVVKKRKMTNLPERTETLETQAGEITKKNSISLGQKRSRASKPKKNVEIKPGEPGNPNSNSLGHKNTHASKLEEKIEEELLEAQLHDVEIILMKHANKGYPLKQELRDPNKTCQQAPVISENVGPAENKDSESPFLEIVNNQEVTTNNETQHESSGTDKDDASKVNIASTLIEEKENGV